MPKPPRTIRVTVAGGGFAAAELLLALRAMAEERVQLELIVPSTRFSFRPASTGAPFGQARVHVYDLERLAADVGARLRRDSVEAVAPAAHRLRLASGAHADYDVLVVAVGARARSAIAGATTFRDERDQHHVARIADALKSGSVEHVAFAAPAGVTWTLPLYELALLTAAAAGPSAQIAVVTPERKPLEVFGAAVSRAVADLLEARAIRVIVNSRPLGAMRSQLALADGGSIPAEHVIAVPRLVGRRLAGVPSGWDGFIPTDARGGVQGLRDVFAAGDVCDFPVKQGGLAAQQADVIAAELAAGAGAAVAQPEGRYVLRSRLLGADGPLYLRTELDDRGRPVPGAATVSAEAPWWPAAKAFGRYLSPWMADQQLQETPNR